jgi:uncharacterized repeat protein (TIGR01451 family)
MTHKQRSIFYTGLPVGAALLLLLAFFFALPGGAVAAPDAPDAPTSKIIVNEFLRSGNLNTSDEWIEILLVQDLTAAELEGFYVGDSTSSTAAKFSGYKFTGMNGIAANFPKGTIIVIGGDTAFTEDTSFNPSGNDWNLLLQTNGSYITGNGSTGDLAGTDVVYADTNGTNGDTNISSDGFAVNWDSTPGTLGSNANVTIAVPTNGTGAALFSGLDGSDNAANWTTSIVTTSLTLGLPNGGDNTTYIESLRSGGATTPDLTIAKTGPSFAVAGDDLVYELSITNQNIDPATNVIVTDTLPVSTTLVSASGGFTQTNPETGVYVWELGEVLSGTQVTFNVTVNVDLNVTAGTVITNTAEVSTDAAGDDLSNNEVEHTATVYPLVSIHDIQYVADPETSDASPYLGQTVFVEGIVTAAPGELGSSAMIIEEPGGGPWSGLYLYKSGGYGSLSAPRGTEVRVLGTVDEYFGLTEFVVLNISVLSTGNTVPGAEVIDTGDFITVGSAEQWESVLIEFQNATVTNPDIGNGEWKFSDGSGETVADDLGNFTYSPALGDFYDSLTGIGWYSFSAYKIEPRNDADIVLGTPPQDLGLTKTGPSVAFNGEEIAYTLEVQNPLMVSLSDVVLTDTLPVSLTNVISTSNAITVTTLGNQIVWEFGELGSGITETVYVTATVPADMPFGTVITNQAAVTTTTPGDDPINNSTSVNTTIYEIVPIATARAGSPNEIFAVEGKVTAATGTYHANEWEIQDDSGGIAVYYYPPLPTALGDTVRVVGALGDYGGQEQLINLLYSANLGSGPEVSPLITDTAVVASGSTEGWLVQVEGIASGVPSSCGFNHSFYLNDGSGAVQIYVDGTTGLSVCSMGLQNGDFVTLTGFSSEYNGTPQIKPRIPADIRVINPAPVISKSAASTVEPGGLLTYTITLENKVGIDLIDITIVDSVPANSTLVSVLDGGANLGGATAQWDLASLPDQSSAEVRFVVQANAAVGENIVNDLYYFEASNWVTQTFGAPVQTYVGAYIPIPTIQGSDFRSPYEGMEVKTRGEVIGFFEGNSSSYNNFDGFFIQDPSGDGNDATSDGIFVNYKNLAVSVNIGDMVEVTGVVNEFDEYDGTGCYGNECLTQVSVSNVGDVTILSAQIAAPQAIIATELNPPGDVAASDIYFEALEGMLVTLPNTSTVVAPTNYGAVSVVRGDLGIDRVIRTGPYEGMPVALRNWELYGDFNGGDAPDLIVGSVVSNADGPLGFSYGDYMIITQDGDEWAVESAVTPPTTVPSWPVAGATQFSVGTFNTYNFDSGASAATKTKVVNTIASFNGAAFVALEEIEGDDTTFMAGVLADLATAGFNYDYAYSHSDIGGHGVSLLWNTDVVTDVTWSTQYQDCSADGSSSSDYDPLWATCRAQGEYPLFSRRPVVVTGTLSLASGDLEVVVIANHFKSKAGNDPSADQRRLEQGMFVNALVADFVASGSSNVIVMGDLNDFEDSPALLALTANDTLINAWTTYAADDPYSYIYEGVSQILDHILVSEALYGWLVDMGALHLNADYPYNTYYDDPANIWHTSDHDPVAATIQVPYLLYMPLIFGGN